MEGEGEKANLLYRCLINNGRRLVVSFELGLSANSHGGVQDVTVGDCY